MTILGSVVGAIAGRAAGAAAASLVKNRVADPNFLIPADALAHIADAAEDYPIIVTERQRHSIEQFLERREVAELLSSWLLINLAEGVNTQRDDLLEDIGAAFDHMAIQWTKDQTREDDWSSHSSQLWTLASESLASAVGHLRIAIKNDAELEDVYSRYNYGARLLRGTRRPSTHILRLIRLLSDPAALLDIPELIDEIRNISSTRYRELNLGHGQDTDDRFDEALLYVERTVVDPSIRAASNVMATVAAEDLLDQDHVARVVIVGDPGVGKSTFVRHVIYTLASQDKARMAPLLVNCREYAASDASKSIIEYISATLSSESSACLSEADLTTVVTIGAACVVFDGVDEIIDLQKRRDFIRKIESLGATYPYISIICSTRKVGYQQTRFNQTFRVLELDEFTSSEFELYVEKWFRATGRSREESEAFLRESEDIKDIRSNPLMLSLLCTLYRTRGHIPRNRRQIYRECADLLFQRWDSMRHIDQPFDHRHYGNRLMQELARFFYGSQVAQAGVEEGQLVRIVAHFFRDSAAVEPPDDEHRARQFLDFCAGRAWLLSRKGTNSRGIRLFSFTHRTFMEYMAAEALVRSSPDIETVVDRVLDVFLRDPSSVIPDVMVQAVDDKFERGAEQTLRTLIEREKKTKGLANDKFLALCLRIINSSPMSRRISAGLPGLIMHYWSRVDNLNDTRESTFALFDLYRDPRMRILSALEGDHPIKWGDRMWRPSSLRAGIVSRWVRIEHIGRAEMFDPEWRAALSKHYDVGSDGAVPASLGRPGCDPVVSDLLLRHGRLMPASAASRGVKPAMCISIFGERVAGSVVHSIRDIVCSNADPVAIEIVKVFDDIITGEKGSRIELAGAYSIGHMLRDEMATWTFPDDRVLNEILAAQHELRRVVWWILAILSEAYGEDHSVHGAFGELTDTFSVLVRHRRKVKQFIARNTTRFGSWSGSQMSSNRDRSGDIRITDLIKWGLKLPLNAATDVTPWTRRWTYGLSNLVQLPSTDFRSSLDKQYGDRYIEPYILERWSDMLANIPEGVS